MRIFSTHHRPLLLGAALLCVAPAIFAQVPAAPAAAAQAGCYQPHTGPDQLGYCKALRVGDLLYVSGQAAGGPMPDAVKYAYDALSKTLAAHGLTFANVVKENVYTTDLDAFTRANAVRKPFYGSVFPAATWVEVRRLANPARTVEVELIAVFPPKPEHRLP